MDGGRFDDLARLVGGGRSRRGVLAVLLGAVATLAPTGAAGRRKDKEKARRRRDRRRRGEAGGDQVGGVEEAAEDAEAELGPSRIGDPCQNDDDCAGYETCQGGVCVCLQPPYIVCADRCVDPRRSERHCGGCGNDCERGETCCQGRCVDRGSDGDNCGVCGRRCRQGEICCDGECVDPEIDPRHCSKCNNGCGNRRCRGGTCAPSDDRFWLFCDGDEPSRSKGRWINTCNNKNHCGGCGNDCGGRNLLDNIIWRCCQGQCYARVDPMAIEVCNNLRCRHPS